MSYYPVLRHSNAEMNAFSTSVPAIQSAIIPIIEGRRLKHSNKKQWDKLFNSAGNFLKERVNEHLFIYDFKNIFDNIQDHSTELLINDKNPVQFLIEKFKEANLNFIPCFNHDSPDWLIQTIKNNNTNSISVRIRYYDIEKPLHSPINNYVKGLLSEHFSDKEIYIIFDFKTKLDRTKIEPNIQFFNDYSNIILSTSSLNEKKDVPKMSFTKVSERNEINLFKELKTDYPQLLFSDYTTRLTPEPDLKKGFNMNNSYLKIYYTTKDGYYLGKSDKFDEGEPENFQQVCDLITQSNLYSGDNYSNSDTQIKRCALTLEEVLSHQKTIELSINHHLQFTIDEL